MKDAGPKQWKKLVAFSNFLMGVNRYGAKENIQAGNEHRAVTKAMILQQHHWPNCECGHQATGTDGRLQRQGSKYGYHNGHCLIQKMMGQGFDVTMNKRSATIPYLLAEVLW